MDGAQTSGKKYTLTLRASSIKGTFSLILVSNAVESTIFLIPMPTIKISFVVKRVNTDIDYAIQEFKNKDRGHSI